jgi:hypothetical protein
LVLALEFLYLLPPLMPGKGGQPLGVCVRSRLGAITRAGLFLLFVTVLALLAPLEVSAEIEASASPASSQSQSDDTRQHDSDKSQERLPGILPGRRVDKLDQFRLLPDSRQPRTDVAGYRWPLTGFRAVSRMDRPADEWARGRHAPAALQVYRH